MAELLLLKIQKFRGMLIAFYFMWHPEPPDGLKKPEKHINFVFTTPLEKYSLNLILCGVIVPCDVLKAVK